jgi:hypothetical protein
MAIRLYPPLNGAMVWNNLCFTRSRSHAMCVSDRWGRQSGWGGCGSTTWWRAGSRMTCPLLHPPGWMICGRLGPTAPSRLLSLWVASLTLFLRSLWYEKRSSDLPQNRLKHQIQDVMRCLVSLVTDVLGERAPSSRLGLLRQSSFLLAGWLASLCSCQ